MTDQPYGPYVTTTYDDGVHIHRCDVCNESWMDADPADHEPECPVHLLVITERERDSALSSLQTQLAAVRRRGELVREADELLGTVMDCQASKYLDDVHPRWRVAVGFFRNEIAREFKS